MSIDAIVIGIRFYENGGGKILLADRPPKKKGEQFGCAGQDSLEYTDAPEEVSAINGCEIWGGSDTVMLGEFQIAKRIGYTKIVFCDRDHFIQAVARYFERKAISCRV